MIVNPNMESKDLFGNRVKPKKQNIGLEKSLIRNDTYTLEDRTLRLKFVNEIFPNGSIIAGDMETVYVFQEAKMAYVNGCFISTILLTQAFIERLLASHFNSIGLEKIARRGIKVMLDHAKKHNLFHDYFINQIDNLRQKRNPFVHLKPFEHEFNISQRIMSNMEKDGSFTEPEKLIEIDAREALRLMYTIFSVDLRT